MTAVTDGDTMGGPQAGKSVALHCPGESLTDGSANDVNELSFDKMVRGEFRAHVKDCILADPEFHQLALGFHFSRSEVTAHWFGHVLDLRLAHAKLHRRIAMALHGTPRNDLTVVHLQHGDRDMSARILEYARHSKLLGDDSGSHDRLVPRV